MASIEVTSAATGEGNKVLTASVFGPMSGGVGFGPAPPAVPRPSDITVEIHRGGTTVNARLPMDERSAAWLSEVLG